MKSLRESERPHRADFYDIFDTCHIISQASCRHGRDSSRDAQLCRISHQNQRVSPRKGYQAWTVTTNWHLNSSSEQTEEKSFLAVGTRSIIPQSRRSWRETGLDFVIIDDEHEAINPETLPLVLAYFANSACLPVARVAGADKVMVKHALDAGARALLFPMINSVAEAEQAVSYCHYPPRGVRGFGPGAASNLYDDLQPYLATISEAINIWVQIEHIDAVQHAEAIARVEGVDALFIGPADLSATMGMLLDFDRPEFQEVIEQIVEAGRRAGKLVVMAVDDTSERALERLAQGIQAVTIGDDRFFLRQGTQAALQAIRSNYPAKADFRINLPRRSRFHACHQLVIAHAHSV